MAVEIAAPAAFRAAGRDTVTTPVDHPVLTTKVVGPESTVLHGLVSAGTHWLLDEHRIGGVPVVPGTGHLESVRAAVVAGLTSPAPQAVVELRDVVFLEPFAVPEGTVAQYRVELTPAEEGVDFAVRSLAAGQLRTHVRGSAGWTVEAAPAARVPVVDGRRVDDDASFGRGRTSMLTFGPRWASLAEHRLGEGEELARIVAPEPVRADLPAWGLHPALLDVATAVRPGPGRRHLPAAVATAGSGARAAAGGVPQPPAAPGQRHRRGGRRRPVASPTPRGGNWSRSATSCCVGSTRARSPAGCAGTADAGPAEPAAGVLTEDIRPVDGAEAFRAA